MTQIDRPLDNPINWSFRVGRLWGIAVRVHILFVLCAVFLVWMQLPTVDSVYRPSFGGMLVDALGIYAILFLIVLAHEFGHCFGARWTGGTADEILVWPLGGLAYVNPRQNPAAHMITAVSGPAVNVLVCMITSVILVAAAGSLGAVPWNPLHPLVPVDPAIVHTGVMDWIAICFGVSYFLLIINLLPIFPFDGGRMLQAWLWATRGYRSSLEIAAGTGMIGAIVVGLVALFIEQSWILLMIAVFGYMNCWQTRRMLRESEMNAGTGFGASLEGGPFYSETEEPREPGYFARRRVRKAAQREERQRQADAARELTLDEVLRKVSQSGLSSLSTRERRFLEQESQRRRNE